MVKFINKKNSQTKLGFTLVELMLSLGILSLFSMSLSWILINFSQKQATQYFLVSVSQNKLLLQGTITNDIAWKNTVANNPILSCLQLGTSCTATQALGAQNIKLYDQNNNLSFDGTNPSSGFTEEGSDCNTYTATGNSNCILHLDLKVSLQCDSSATSIDVNCLAPYVKIRGSFIYPGQKFQAVNWPNYSFNFSRATQKNNNSSGPCPGSPPAAPCASPSQWLCMGPLWECHYFAM